MSPNYGCVDQAHTPVRSSLWFVSWYICRHSQHRYICLEQLSYNHNFRRRVIVILEHNDLPSSKDRDWKTVNQLQPNKLQGSIQLQATNVLAVAEPQTSKFVLRPTPSPIKTKVKVTTVANNNFGETAKFLTLNFVEQLQTLQFPWHKQILKSGATLVFARRNLFPSDVLSYLDFSGQIASWWPRGTDGLAQRGVVSDNPNTGPR